MDLPKIRTVVSDPAQPDGDRLVLLRMSEKGIDSYSIPWNIRTESICKPADIPAKAQEFLDKEAKGLVQYNFDLDYDYWTAGASVLQYVFANWTHGLIQRNVYTHSYLKNYGTAPLPVSRWRVT